MNKCTDSGWHCLPSQVYFYLERAIRVGQITLIVLSWTVVKLNVSLCESCFSYGSPQLWECSSSEALTESLGTFMPSGWIFLQYEAAESSVQPLGSSLLLRFASFLYCDLYKSATTTEGRQHRPGGSLLSPTFPSRMLAYFSSAVLWDCQKFCSASQPLSFVWLRKHPVPGGGKQLGISDSLLCISLLSLTSASKSWLHWELSSTLNQVVSLCLIWLL